MIKVSYDMKVYRKHLDEVVRENDVVVESLEKTVMLGKIESKRRKGQKRVVRWHHQLNGHESEQGPRDSVGQGSQACCSSWGRKELETTEQLNNSKVENLSHHLVPSHIIYSSPESEEPSRHSASLLVAEREK